MKRLSRRGFLTFANQAIMALSWMAGLAGLWRFLGYAPQPPHPKEFDLGPASDYPVGSRTHIREARAILFHTSSGFNTLSLICPHLGCEVSEAGIEYHCPCHGSRFDSQGAVIRGPAAGPLRTLRVEEQGDGRLVLFSD